MTTIRIVTDSTADLSHELIARYNITVVPAYVNYNGQSYADDGVALVRADYYAQLASITPPPKTAAPPPGVAEEMITGAFAGADHMVVITVSENLSGIPNSLRLGAASLPQDRVHFFDSGLTSMALGLMVITAAEVAEETGDVAQVMSALQRLHQHTRLYAGLETIDYLRRSGRVSWAVAGIGALLRVRPMLLVHEGRVDSVARARTEGKMLEALAEKARSHAPLDRVALLHINNEAATHTLREMLADVLPPPERVISGMIGTAVGTHTGPGTVGIATMSQAWRTR